jgi:hypothetical protein
MNAVLRTRQSLDYYEPFVPLVSEFLADPPTSAPDAAVFDFRLRLLKAGVGGSLSHSLLED